MWKDISETKRTQIFISQQLLIQLFAMFKAAIKLTTNGTNSEYVKVSYNDCRWVR